MTKSTSSGRGADVGGLLHQLRIDTQPSGGVDDDHIVLLTARRLDAGARDRDRVADAVARFRGEDRRACSLGDDLQLVDGVRALQVARDQERGVAVLLEPLGELAGEGGLSRALEPREHDDGGRVLREFEATLLTAEDGHELLVDDLNDLLRRVQGPVHLVAQRALAHLRGEILDDRQRHVGVEQRTTDLADGAVDVRGSELPFGAEVAEGLGEPVGESAESRHDPPILRVRGGSARQHERQRRRHLVGER